MTSLPRGESHDAAPSDAAAVRYWALVPCAGTGTRAGTAGRKQYEHVAGRPLVAWTLDALSRVPELEVILVVLAADDDAFDRHSGGASEAIASARVEGRPRLAIDRVGGATRAHSVSNGIDALRARGAGDDDWVLVHDAARCLVHPESISRLVAACRDDDVGGLLALPVPDTLKRSIAQEDGADRVASTVPRAHMWAAQTPQMFRLGLLRRALVDGLARPELSITDEASAVEALGLRPRLVRGDYENLKVTWPEDFALAERVLRGRMMSPHAVGVMPSSGGASAISRIDSP
jgi:2-C-methyl-D-erythritol 4-phosphate cytidylyltransferase